MMVNMHGVQLESKAQQLLEVDRQIRDNTCDLVRLIRQTAKPEQISVMANFVRTLFGRRETILREMAKLGISEGDVYRALRSEAESKEEAAKCTG